MKKTKFILGISLGFSAAFLTATTLAVVSCGESAIPNYYKELGYENLDVEQTYNPNTEISAFGGNVNSAPIYTNNYKIIARYPRQINDEVYESDCEKWADFFGWPSITNFYNNPQTESYAKIQAAISAGNMQNVNDYLKNNNKYNGEEFTNPDFIVSEIKNKTFKKHPAMTEMFGKFSVQNEQPAVSKAFGIGANTPTMYMTGLYAPPGEVITLKIPKKSLPLIKSKGMTIVIGDEWQDMEKREARHLATFRLPYMTTRFYLNSLIDWHSVDHGDYISIDFGSVYGGSILFSIGNDQINSKEIINFTIDNAIEYLHYDLGKTTDEEWFRLAHETNTPIMTINNDTNVFFKPVFNISNYAAYDEFNLVAKQQTPFSMAMAHRLQTLIAQYVNAIDLYKNVKYKIPFYINDYVLAGGAVNIGRSKVQAPMYWGGVLLDSNLSRFNAFHNWGTVHEINHSYEKYHLFANSDAEVYNNLLSVLNYSILSPNTSQRFINPGMFEEGGWSWTGSLFSIFNPRYNGEWFHISNDDHNIQYGLFSLVYILGSNNFIDFARELTITKNQPELRKLDSSDKIYDFDAWTMYLVCKYAKADLSVYLEKMFERKILGNSDWEELKTIIKQQYVQHFPVANLYASQQGYQQKDGSWFYPGSSQQAMIIDNTNPTVLNFANTTKFSFQYDKTIGHVKIENVSITNSPKYGEIKLGTDSKSIIYTPYPNSNDSNLNQFDELEIELRDNYDHVYRIKIKLHIFKPSKYVDTVYEIDPNKSVTINDEEFKILDALKNTNPLENPNVEEFFNNFDNYKKDVVSTANQEIKIHSNQIATNHININQNQIRETKLYYQPKRSGYYRINGSFEHQSRANYDYGIVQNANNETQVLIENERWLGNANEMNFGHYFERETKPVFLDSNQIYQIKFYSAIKSSNLTQQPTYSRISINYVGNNPDELTNNIVPQQQPWLTEPTSYSVDDLNKLQKLGVNLKENYEILNDINLDKIYVWSHNVTKKEENILDYTKLDNNNNVDGSAANQDSLVDSLDVTLKRFVGIIDHWFQIQYKPNNYSNGTSLDFSISLNKPLTFDKIEFKKYNNDMMFQKIKIYDPSVSSDEPIYDGFVNEWWANPWIELQNAHTFNKKIRFVIMKSDNLAPNTPSEAQEIARNNLYNWIKTPSNPFVFSYNEWKDPEIDYLYTSYSANLKVDNRWNISSENAIFNGRKLITRNRNASIEFNCSNVSKIKIFGETFNTKVDFDVYVDNQLVFSGNNFAEQYNINALLANLSVNKNQSHHVKIVAKNASDSNPFSIQAIGFEE